MQGNVMQGRGAQGMKLRAQAPPIMFGKAVELGKIPTEELVGRNQLMVQRKVLLSFVNDPSDFYVTLSGESLDRYLSDIQNGLTEAFSDPYHKQMMDMRVIEDGMACAALFVQDGNWYRGIVTAATTADMTKVKVRFVDYGNEEMISISDVKHLPEKFAQVPILSVRCFLKDAIPSGPKWTRDSRAFMESLLEEQLICIFHSYNEESDKYEVELMNPNSVGDVPVLVLGALRKIHAAAQPPGGRMVGEGGPIDEISDSDRQERKIYTSTTVDIPGMDSPLEVPAEIGEYLDVIVSYVEPKGNAVMVNMVQEVPVLEQLNDDLNGYCAKADRIIPSSITLGSLCAAKYSEDGNWYRAVILSKYGSGYWEVYFVDYGNREMVSDETDMKPVPKHLRSYPPQAIRCIIRGLPDWVETAPLRGLPVTIRLEEEGRNRKAFEVSMFYLDEKRGEVNVVQELLAVMNKPRQRQIGGRK